MKTPFKLAIAALAVCVMTVATAQTASAAPTQTEPSVTVQSQPAPESPTEYDAELAAQIEEQIRPLVEAVTFNGADSVFNADDARANGATDQEIADFTAGFESEGFSVIGNVTAVPAEATVSGLAAMAKCTGKNGYVGYFAPFVGYQWALNSCNTDKLVAAVALGAAGAGAVTAVLAMAGVPHAATAAGIVAAFLTFGVATLNVCKAFSPKKAIYLNSGIPAPAPIGTLPTCWGQ